jgi:hypothetical protein
MVGARVGLVCLTVVKGQRMPHAMTHGLRAGALAGLLMVGLFFVDDGPATNLSMVAHWFALDLGTWSKLIGAILLVLLGMLFGGLMSAFTRTRSLSLVQGLAVGVVTGLLWWAVLVLLLGTLIRHTQQSPYGWLFWFVTSLLYGLVLGGLYVSGSRQGGKQEQHAA